MNDFLCEYGTLIKEDGYDHLYCSLTNSRCLLIRYCANDMCIKMSKMANDCIPKKIKLYSQQ